MGPLSFSVIAQQDFLNRYLRGDLILGSVWRTPNWVRENKICVRVGPPSGSSFEIVFRPWDFPIVFFASPCPGRGHFGVRLVDPESGPQIQTSCWILASLDFGKRGKLRFT